MKQNSFSRIIMICGFILTGVSFLIHVVSWAGYDIQSVFPPVMIMHLGVFVCFIPAVLSLTRYRMKHNQTSSLKEVLKIIPLPLLIVQIILMLWYGFCFYYSMQQNAGGGPNIIDGQFVLSNHGNIIRQITEEQYRYHSSVVLIMFSALWMAFNWSSSMILVTLSQLLKEKEDAHV